MISRANIETVINSLKGYSPNPANQPKFEWFHEPYELPEIIHEGGRNNELLRYAGHMRAKGIPEKEILKELLRANADRCHIPLEVGEVIEISGRYEKSSNERINASPRGLDGFKFIHVADLKVIPTRFLVKNFIEENSISAFVGASNSGKSLLAISLACAISSGTPWFGKQTKQGVVFYIAGEGQNGLARRAQVAASAIGLKREEMQLFVSNMPAPFSDPNAASLVAERISEMSANYGKPALIILDTVARNFGDGDENSTKDMGLFIQNLDAYLRVKFDAAVILVHHTGHSDQNRARGSSALNAALDTSYLVATDDFKVMRVSCTKAKEFPEPPPMALKILSEGSGEESVGYLQQVTYTDPSNAAGLGQNQTTVMRVLNNLLVVTKNPVTVDLLRSECASAGVGSRGFRDALRTLINDRREIFQVGEYLHTAPPDGWEFEL
jgi:hypothetical protein